MNVKLGLFQGLLILIVFIIIINYSEEKLKAICKDNSKFEQVGIILLCAYSRLYKDF